MHIMTMLYQHQVYHALSQCSWGYSYVALLLLQLLSLQCLWSAHQVHFFHATTINSSQYISSIQCFNTKVVAQITSLEPLILAVSTQLEKCGQHVTTTVCSSQPKSAVFYCQHCHLQCLSPRFTKLGAELSRPILCLCFLCSVI